MAHDRIRDDATKARHRRSRGRRPEIEGLETRLALATTAAASHALHAREAAPTLAGRISDQATGKGIGGVTVELIDDENRVVRTTKTGAGGRYKFVVPAQGTYVVHAVTPRRFVQSTPDLSNPDPAGAYLPPYGNNSWNYVTGNSDPTLGAVGPASWATIAPAGNQSFGSPINLGGPTVDLSRYVTVRYQDAVPSQAIDNGHQIQVQFPATGADTVTIAGASYNLAQFHFHGPSENTVDNRAYPMELHFVNQSASGAESVVAVFLQLGAHNPALDPILDAARADLARPDSASKSITSAIHFAGLLPANTQGWHYQGTLTTPPLSGPVRWFVYATPITLDFAQLQKYEQIAAGAGFLPNARPVQPRDGRRLNAVDYNVMLGSQSLAGLNFTMAQVASAPRKAARA